VNTYRSGMHFGPCELVYKIPPHMKTTKMMNSDEIIETNQSEPNMYSPPYFKLGIIN